MGTVLVVDDEVRNRALVRAVLERSCTVVEAGSAAEACDRVRAGDVDLVLLDVLMPEESGVDAARRIKALSADFLPVIMLTALSEQADRNAALEAGADDFITKPFDKRELQLRVKSFLQLRRQDQIIRRQRDELRKVIDLKDDLFGLLVHDLRNPLTSVIAMLALLRDEAPSQHQRDDAGLGLAAARRVGGVLDDILQLIALEAGAMTLAQDPLSLQAVASDARESLRGAARDRDVELAVHGDASVVGDGALLRRAVENLVANAVRYAPRGSVVDVDIEDGDVVVLSVSDRGPGVPERKKAELFVKFGGVPDQERANRRSYGFGLYLVDLVARAHKGSARVVDRDGGGARFEVTLPHNQP